MTLDFWIIQFWRLCLLAIVAYLCGLLVVRAGLKVNYTRKINFFALFFAPFLTGWLFPRASSMPEKFLAVAVGVLSLLVFCEPVRRRLSLVATMFASYDRVEDRPHTLRWLISQIFVGYLVIIPMAQLLAVQGLAELAVLPVLMHGFGDGLAEPVGIRFGRHKYSTRELFGDRRYTRSYEGSACVFLASVVILLAFHALFTPVQLAAAWRSSPFS
jgi:phytol kinase